MRVPTSELATLTIEVHGERDPLVTLIFSGPGHREPGKTEAGSWRFKGIWALALLVIKTRASNLPIEDATASRTEIIRGGRGTVACSLADAFEKKNAWIARLFGSIAKAEKYINAAGRDTFTVYLRDTLSARQIGVYHDGRPISDNRDELDRLASMIEDQWKHHERLTNTAEQDKQPEARPELGAITDQTSTASDELHGELKIDEQTIRLYQALQTRELESWRLFDFGRDIRLEQVFVQEVFEEARAGPIPIPIPLRDPIPDDELLDEVLSKKTKKDSRCWLIQGEPGSGKSTVLRSWTLRIFKKLERSAPSKLPTPIFLSLRYLSEFLRRSGNTTVTVDALAHCFSSTIPGISSSYASAPFQHVEQLREQEHARLRQLLDRWRYPSAEWLLLLDGLDEMKSEYQEPLFSWIKGLPIRVRVVISTRPYITKYLGGIPYSVQFNVCNFNKEQIDALVKKWFAENQDLGSQLLSIIDSAPSLRPVAAVPLLLTCLCLLTETGGAAQFTQSTIYTRRVYEWFVELLLDGWDAHRAHRPPNRVLTRLGIEVLTDLAGRFDFDTGFGEVDLVQVIKECAQRLSAPRSDQDHLETVLTQPGRMLAENVEDCTYRFRLQAFWDFFCSRAITSPWKKK